MKRACAILLAIVVISGIAAPVRAQVPDAPPDTNPAAAVIPRLLTEGARLSPGPHATHFIDGLRRSTLPLELNVAVGLALTSDPSQSVLDDAYGIFVPLTSTPARAAAASTLPRGTNLPFAGGGNVVVGLTHRAMSIASLDGRDLGAGAVAVVVEHAGAARTASGRLVDDVVYESLSADIERRVTAIDIRYGVKDRLEIGGVAPIVHVRMQLRSDARIVRIASSTVPARHNYDGVDQATRIVYDGASTVGLGDIIGRVRAALVVAPTWTLIARGELTLPTGNAEQWLGLGAVRALGGVAWTATRGVWRPRASFAYAHAWRTSERDEIAEASGAAPDDAALDVPDDLRFTAGAAWRRIARFEIAGDIVAERRQDQRVFEQRPLTANPTPVPVFVPAAETVLAPRRAQNAVAAIASARFAVSAETAIAIDMSWPLTRTGFTTGPVWTASIRQSF